MGLLSSFEDKTRKTLVGIGIATILVPAVVLDLEAQKAIRSSSEFIFGRWANGS
jgi:hypothetical protein